MVERLARARPPAIANPEDTHIDKVLDDNGLSRLQWRALVVLSRSPETSHRDVRRVMSEFTEDAAEVTSALNDLVDAEWIARTHTGYALTGGGAAGYRAIEIAVARIRARASAEQGSMSESC